MSSSCDNLKQIIQKSPPPMSFQTYLDNIEAKTGKTPDDFKKLAEEKGFMMDGKLNPTTKATEITNWL